MTMNLGAAIFPHLFGFDSVKKQPELNNSNEPAKKKI